MPEARICLVIGALIGILIGWALCWALYWSKSAQDGDDADDARAGRAIAMDAEADSQAKLAEIAAIIARKRDDRRWT